MTSATDDHELVVERVFTATAATVFRAWTDPEQLVHWFGPSGFSLTIIRFDLKVGGVWEYVLHGPDGTDYPNRAIFRIIDPPRRLEYDNQGGHIEDNHLTARVIVTFKPDGFRTVVTLTMRFTSDDALQRAKARGAEQGGRESLDRLAEWLVD